MSYANYENNFILAETERFTAERITANDIEETAILLVTKSLAEANAEEILDIVLDSTFDRVCPETPRCIHLCDYDKPTVTTPSLGNILSVLEMESNLPAQQKTKNSYLREHSNESGNESSEEPVFTSPIYVKSGPENINILQENGIAKSCDMVECTPDLKQQQQERDSSVDIKYEAHENIANSEESSSEGNDRIMCAVSASRMNISCHASENVSKPHISDKKDAEYSENIGDAKDTINTVEKIEPKSNSSEQNVSLTGKIIGDVVPDLNVSDEEIHIQPQVVQAYVLYPGGPANAEDTIAAKNENTLATELEGDAFDLNSLNKEEDTSSPSNEANGETSLAANEVSDLLNYFEQVNNTVDLRVRIVDNSSDEGISNATCEEVKRAVKEIAAAVFEGQGDGMSTELSNLSIQLANRQEQITSEIPVGNPVQLPSADQFWITQVDSEQSQSTQNSDVGKNILTRLEEQSTSEIHAETPVKPPATDQFWSNQMDLEQSHSTPNSDWEEEIAVHETLSVDSDLQEFLSEMHMHDEMDEREVQIILRDDEGETESLNGAAFGSDYQQCSNYLAASGLDPQDEVDNFSYRSGSNIAVSLKRSCLDTSKITHVVDEFYSLRKMARNMEKKNPKVKANLAIGKTTSSRKALGPIRIEQSSEELSDEEKTEDAPPKKRESRWRRVRNMLSCFKRNRPSSDEA